MSLRIKSYCLGHLVIAVFLLPCLIDTSVFAQTGGVEVSVESSTDYLRKLDQQLTEIDSAELDFKTFYKEIAAALLPFENNVILRDRLLQSEVSAKLQVMVSAKLLIAYNEKQLNLHEDLRAFISHLVRIFPAASPFVFKLREEEQKISAIVKCENGINFPSCIWKLVFDSSSPDKEFIVLEDSIARGLKSEDVDLLSKLILLVVKTDYLKNNLSAETCDSFSNRVRHSKNIIPNGSEDQTLASLIKAFNSAVKKNSFCLNVLQTSFEIVSKDVCSKGFASSCLSAIGFLESHNAPEDKLDWLRKSFIVSVTDPTAKEIASGMVTKGVFSQLNFKERLKLLLDGTLPTGVYLVLIILVTLPVVLGLLYFILPSFFSFVSKVFSMGGNSKFESTGQLRDDEYSTLLKIFGLGDDASSSDIKKAYRNMVKLHHPDSADREALAEFEKVQEAYERLMELRKGWFGLGKD